MEIQHQSSLNEVELESRRQKRSLRTKNIRNPGTAASTERRNTLTEVIPENTSPPPYEINEKTKF